mmetsp:Transcript_48772/g.76137  ORF Transcript_48772/g.76137 Transcript_48772/m.76137 type:complete len:314 (-) Transcript_48772:92-1033(-)
MCPHSGNGTANGEAPVVSGEQTIEMRSMSLPEGKAHAIKLYCAWFCPYAQRAWAHLEELVDYGLEYTYIPINPYVDTGKDDIFTKQPLTLEQKSAKYPEFVAASPRGLVPAISVDEDVAVNDSWVCCEFLSEFAELQQNGLKRGKPDADSKVSKMALASLMPKGAHDRAKVRMFWEHCGSQVIPFFYKSLMAKDQEGREAALESLRAGLRKANEMMLRVSSSGYFLGDRYSMADLALGPWWQRFYVILKTYRQFEVPQTAEYSRLHDWWRNVSKRPSFARTIVSHDRLVNNYREYADGSATSEVARTIGKVDR